MGEIAEYLLNGDDCQYCGEYLGEGDGYPRSCDGCEDNEGDEDNSLNPAKYIDAAIMCLNNAKEKLARKKIKSIDGFIKQLNIFKNSL